MVRNNNFKSQKGISKKRKSVFIISSTFLSFFSVMVIGELFIRATNLPGIDKNIKYIIDPVVGYGYLPNSRLYYCNMKGDVVQKRFNSFGYLDAEHKKEKEKGIYRIGFFGDSYVEARQVPLEGTFFQIAEKKLSNYNVECMAFGLDGGSTLVAYLNNKRWLPYFDIDLSVYVFCENDPGDNVKEIKEKTAPYFPFAFLTNDGYQIDYTSRDKFIGYSNSFLYKAHTWISNHLLLARAIKQRIIMIINHGVGIAPMEKDRNMTTRAAKNRAPDQNDLPSTWPPELKEYSEKLTESIILKWRNEVKTYSKDFAILYVPRNAEEMRKGTKEQDSWKLWLESFCNDKNIAFIDPTKYLVKMQDRGKDISYDHFTIYGHEAFANAFVGWFKKEAVLH